jgi:hypothetical protein
LSTQIEKHIGQKVAETVQWICHWSALCRVPNVGDFEACLLKMYPIVFSTLSGNICFAFFVCCKKLEEFCPKFWRGLIQMRPEEKRNGVRSAGSCF